MAMWIKPHLIRCFKPTPYIANQSIGNQAKVGMNPNSWEIHLLFICSIKKSNCVYV